MADSREALNPCPEIPIFLSKGCETRLELLKKTKCFGQSNLGEMVARQTPRFAPVKRMPFKLLACGKTLPGVDAKPHNKQGEPYLPPSPLLHVCPLANKSSAWEQGGVGFPVSIANWKDSAEQLAILDAQRASDFKSNQLATSIHSDSNH